MKFLKDKRILITGANGFVGKNLIELLSKYELSLFGIYHSNIVGFENDRLVDMFKTDITNYNSLKRVLEDIKPNIIFNLASIVTAARNYSLFRDMVEINLNVLYSFYDLLKGKDYFDLFINMGSSEEYGDCNGIPCEENFMEKSTSPYAVTKTAGAKFIYMISKNENFPAITIRPSVLFGKYQPKDKFIPYVINSLLNNEELKLTYCEQTRDFLYVERFCKLLIDLIETGKYQFGDIYNISSGINFSLREIVEHIKNVINPINPKISFGKLAYRKNEIMNISVSNKKLKGIINFQLKREDILDDLTNYVRYEIK
jgi:nucleoside-diphosphate-sugar epimerase